jgi:hypothetical protein
MQNGFNLFSEAVTTAQTWLTSYMEMMAELNESHLQQLHPDFQTRFWETEMDALDGFVFGKQRPIATVRQFKIARINSLLIEQRKAEHGTVYWPSELSTSSI